MTFSKPPVINILNAIAYLANVIVMFGLGIFGMRIYGEVPASFPTLVTPAAWSRLIWPVIMLIELVWVILQLLPRYCNESLVTAVGRNFIIASVAQIAWSLFFSYQILSLAFVSIIVMIVFLFLIIRAQSSIDCTSIREYMMLKFPFSILFGWIIVATIVDINVLLVAMGLSTTLQFYAALVSLSGMLIAAGSFSDLTVVLVIAWAMIGIFVELKNPDYLITMVFQEVQISTVRGWTIVSFFITLALAAWRGYSLWRAHSSGKENDTVESGGSAAEDGQGGNYTNMV